tara:strand:+ start:1841 stop:2860 length:1020 start_codon:yes stop_codon:yes gene_type:complete
MDFRETHLQFKKSAQLSHTSIKIAWGDESQRHYFNIYIYNSLNYLNIKYKYGLKKMYKLFNIPLKNPIGNAAGVLCYNHRDLNTMLHSNSGFIVTKSCTLNRRLGNATPRFWANNEISINSMGLPNKGLNYYLSWIRKNGYKKPTILSIANIDNDQTTKILERIYPLDYIHLPEINVSCPNIIGKPQLAYDFEGLHDFLFFNMSKNYNKPYGLKLPPFFDPIHIEKLTEIIALFPMIKYITCCNSIGNTLILDKNKNPVIKPKNGLGGLGGTFMKPIGLANVYGFKKMFKEKSIDIDIIGCGGIMNKVDVEEYISVGASCVQVGTSLWNSGPKLIDTLI